MRLLQSSSELSACVRSTYRCMPWHAKSFVVQLVDVSFSCKHLAHRGGHTCTSVLGPMLLPGNDAWLTSPPGAASGAAVQPRRRLLDHVENDTAMAFSVGAQGSTQAATDAVVQDCKLCVTAGWVHVHHLDSCTQQPCQR